MIWTLSLFGILNYHEGDTIPRFIFPLFIPVVLCLTLLLNRTFSEIISSIPLSVIVGVQTFRLAGFAFLIVANLGILPALFSSGGYGDILTGILALIASLSIASKGRKSAVYFYAFNLAGMIDLLNVAFMLLYFYPIWYHSGISSAAAFDFSLIMIPAIAAPVALILHIFSLRNYLLKQKA